MTKTLLRALGAGALLSFLVAAAAGPLEAELPRAQEEAEERSESAEKPAEDEQVQTPFGPAAKSNRTPPPSDKPVDPMVKVTENGDEITFTRQTPFGGQTWKRKLSELSSHETMLLERSRAAAKKAAAISEPAAEKPAP